MVLLSFAVVFLIEKNYQTTITNFYPFCVKDIANYVGKIKPNLIFLDTTRSYIGSFLYYSLFEISNQTQKLLSTKMINRITNHSIVIFLSPFPNLNQGTKFIDIDVEARDEFIKNLKFKGFNLLSLENISCKKYGIVSISLIYFSGS
jgi:hypothetical protein